MSHTAAKLFATPLILIAAVAAQQECYYGPGADYRGPSNLVPCQQTGESACCLLGDTCLSGNTCYNYGTGDLYQYGCTDITYTDSSCPFKCGANYSASPWTALEYCADLENVSDTWICHDPESCGCDWGPPTYDLLVLEPRGCKAMGSQARIALYAPSTLAPYVSLPSTFGGQTSYYSGTTINGTSTWISTAIAGYTPATVSELTTYQDGPSSIALVQGEADVTPSASTISSPVSYTPSSTGTASPGSSAPASSSATATASTIASTSTPITSSSSSTAPAATSTAASSGLSVGAKAGIGVGAAGGFCLVAAVGVAAFLWGRSHRAKSRSQPEVHDAHGQAAAPGYPGSPPMQQSGGSYFPSPDKPPGWQQPGYPMAYSGHMQPYPYDVRPMYGNVPSPPLMDERSQKSGPGRIPSPPMELSAEAAHVRELESSPVRYAGTPSPPYAD